MSSTLGRYLSMQFLVRVVATVLALAALVQTLDLLDVTTEILQRKLGFAGIGTYVALRLPSVLDQVILLGVLLGGLLTFLQLAARSEIVIMRAAGVTIWRLLRMLTPALLAIIALHFIITDQIAPRTEQALSAWWADTTPDDEKDGDPVWFRLTPYMVSADRVLDSGTRMENLRLYRRENSTLTSRIVAREARFEAGRWIVSDGVEVRVDQGKASQQPLDDWVWDAPLSPADLVRLSNPHARLSTSITRALLAGGHATNQPSSYYETHLQQIYAVPLGAFVMLMIGLPLAYATPRGGQSGRLLAIGLGLGLLFLLTQGVLAALGEAGRLPPLLATWAGLAAFGCIAATRIIRREDR